MKLLVLIIAGIILLFPVLLKAQSSQVIEGRSFTVASEQVHPGLQYLHYQADTSAGLPLDIHLLKVDLNQITIQPALAMDQVIGQETVSSMVQRNGALAGINGGFSFSNNPWNIFHGAPRDLLIIEGEVISEPYKTRSSFGIVNTNEGQIPIIDQLQLNTYLIANKDTLKIDGINRIRDSAEIILYTPSFHRTTLTENNGTEILFEKEKVKSIEQNQGSAIIPLHGYVVSVDEAASNELEKIDLQKGTKANIQYNFSSLQHPSGKVNIAKSSYVTAGPALIQEGAPIDNLTSEQIPVSFDTTRHPRTAIGISEDKKTLWLMVVDGRQPNLSMGMSLTEVKAFMQHLGAYEAYNLDGGGSSTMVIGSKIINSPSDPNERRRCDALLLFEK